MRSSPARSPARTGAFRVQGLRPGAYAVRITFLGFAPKIAGRRHHARQAGRRSRHRPARRASPSRSAGRRRREAGRRHASSQIATRIAPRTSRPRRRNASQVLEATPAVTVDADGKVSLRGNENVAIQINGRPAPISGAQLGAYLKSLPAGLLDRVEVVPNPSAKYDPEGMAGIINIVLKQNVDLGISAGLTVGAANKDKYNASGNLGYQVGKLTTFSNLGIFSDDRNVIGINDRLRYDDVNALLSATEQDIDGSNGFKGQNFGTNVDYKLNARDVLSNSHLDQPSSTRPTTRAPTTRSSNGSRTLLDRYLRPRDNESKGTQHRLHERAQAHDRAAQERAVGRGPLQPVARRGRDVALARVGVVRRASRTARRSSVQRDNVDAVTKSVTGQVDYTRQLGTTKLESGVKSNARWLDRDLRRREGLARRRELGAQQPEQRVHLRRAGPRGVRGGEPSARQGRDAGRTARRVREPRLRARRQELSVPLHELLPERSAELQPDAVQPGEGQLLAPHPSPGHAGAQPVPDVLRRPERLPRQSGAESGVHRRVRAGLQQERQVRLVPAVALLPAHHQRHPLHHQHGRRGGWTRT